MALGTETIHVAVRWDERVRARLVVKPSGEVEARVPAGTSRDVVHEFVRVRTRWILKQRDYFDRYRPVDPPRRYVNGETVRYLGRQYRLRIGQAGESSAKLQGRYLVIDVPDVRDTSAVRDMCRAWYSSRANDVVRRRMAHCAASAARHGISTSVLQFRWMTQRWGSFSKAGRLTINPVLVIAPTDVIDYVLTHELCHTVHANHGRAFYRLLATVMPDWEARRERLDRLGRHLTY
jgi:predicted metal-dependent hydrolase